MNPSHDVKKVRTSAYRFSGYKMKRIITQANNIIVEALPANPTTPYGNLTDRAIATPSTPPVKTIQAGAISYDSQIKK